MALFGKKKFKKVEMPEEVGEDLQEEEVSEDDEGIEEELDENKYWAKPVDSAEKPKFGRSMIKPKMKEEVRVVKELPLQPVRSYVEKGTKVTFITIEEALSELMNQE